MDPDVGRWVLEFLLSQNSPRGKLGVGAVHPLIKNLLLAIPISFTDFRLQKTALLNVIQEDLSTLSISEDMLAKLETLQEIHRLAASTPSPILSAAYCAVAVACTFRYLQMEPPSRTDYLSAVDRIWRGRVRQMERSSVLFSDDLMRWSCALLDPETAQNLSLRDMNSSSDAVEKLWLLLDEEWKALGPSFLEIAASASETAANLSPNLHTVENMNLVQPVEHQSVSVSVENTCVDAPIENQRKDEPAENQSKDAAIENESADADFQEQHVFQTVHNEDVAKMTTTTCQSINAPVENLTVDVATEIQAVKEPVENVCIDASVENQSKDAATENQGIKAPFENKCIDAPVQNQNKDAATENQGVNAPVENMCIDAPVESQNKDAATENQDRNAPVENMCIDAPVENKGKDVATENHSQYADYLEQHACQTIHNDDVAKTSTACHSMNAPVENLIIDAPVENQSTGAPIENQSKDAAVENQNPNSLVVNEIADENLQDHARTTTACQSKARRPNLMERNKTACTYEWDSPDSLEEETSHNDHASRIRLPSPKRTKMSPLKIYNPPPKIASRRKVKKWSALEEETLRAAVNKLGEGKWKYILESHADIFSERTQTDLKDKWRNLLRYRAK